MTAFLGKSCSFVCCACLSKKISNLCVLFEAGMLDWIILIFFLICQYVGDRAWFVRLYGEIIPEL